MTVPDVGAGVDSTTLVPAGGLALVIVTLVSYLLRQLVVDRRYTVETVAGEQARTKAAEARVKAAEARADRFQARLDVEHEKRRDAEGAAAATAAELAAVRRVLEHHQRELQRLSGRPSSGEGEGV